VRGGPALAEPADRFPASRGKRAFPWLLTAAFALTLAFSLRTAEVDLRLLVDPQSLANAARFGRGALPPRLDLPFLGFLLTPAIETIQISVMGMVIAVLVGAPLGLLATSSLTWRGILHERAPRLGRWALGLLPYGMARALLSVFRSIPEYVWAFMFVRAVGLGPFAGVLALGVAYGGMLGKVYSEILESVNPRPLEALHAGGAGKSGIVLYGLVPEALPHVISYTLYRWECAIRASAIMGFVGAGGLGQQVELSMRMFQFDEVVTLLAVLLVLVGAVDVVSGRIRAAVVR
jgi:phosphonate transport system permease protein